MSQITIRRLPDNIEKQIRNLSKKNNASLNKTIIELLKNSLGQESSYEKKRSLSDLCGSWKEKEHQEFESNIKEFKKIDSEIWSR